LLLYVVAVVVAVVALVHHLYFSLKGFLFVI